MSILDDLAKKGLAKAREKINEDGSEWVDKGVDKAKEQIAQSDLPAPVKEEAENALEKIRSQADNLKHLTEEGLVAVVGLVASGRRDKAVAIYLRTEASWSELRNASLDASKHTASVARSKSELLDTLAAIGQEAAQRALPFLIAAL